MRSNIFYVVMAGGSGTRFWPRGRRALPKQFLDVLSGPTLFQQALSRIPAETPPENILVLTHADYRSLVLHQAPALRPENITLEPSARVTAPCLHLAAAVLEHKSQDVFVFVIA